MNDLPPPSDPVEAMGEAYELLLEKILQAPHQVGAFLHHVIDEVQGDSLASGKLSEEEVAKLKKYVKRDLIDAAQYRDKTGKELHDWLDFDLALIKRELWEKFSAAADKTTTELLEIKLQAEIAQYHTGELTGLGTLVCDQCGEKLHFYKPGHIPPCPKCNGTRFHRQSLE